MTVRTRFAPSPTGPLHLGHAYSALVAHDLALSRGGAFLLRIEDLDSERSRPEWEALIFEDLAWLGLDWERPVLRQSEHLHVYRDALETLGREGLAYPCSCNRADIRAAASAPQEGAPRLGPDGIVYPGTCRRRSWRDRRPGDAIRLRLDAALGRVGPLTDYVETGIAPRCPVGSQALLEGTGDIVLARRMTGAPAYHLAVVIDDARQGVTHVVRGADLAEATPVQIVLQKLLGLPTPSYHHHRLIRDETGKRLAKRDDARALSSYRAQGASPNDIREMLGL